MLRIVLDAEEVLALDHYFTRRAGYIGHEDAADQKAHELANIIAKKAEEIRIADNRNRQSGSE